jgi:hypothetical protein
MGVETTSWQPDPFGVHEFRFFSSDGKPTLLVMDAGKTSYDPPPSQRPAPAPAPAANAGRGHQPVPECLESIESPSQPPPLGATLTLASPGASVRAPRGAAEPSRPADVAGGGDAGSSSAARPAVPIVGEFSRAHRFPELEQSERQTLSRSRKIAYLAVCGTLVLSLLGLAYVHLRRSESGPSVHASSATTTMASRTGPSTSATTVALPAALSSSADAAATALVSSWSAGNKATALTVATPAAVATLFAAPYTDGLAIARGCSTDFSPIVCTFGPPGGASPSDAIYQVLVTQATGGWYVSSVRVQG